MKNHSEVKYLILQFVRLALPLALASTVTHASSITFAFVGHVSHATHADLLSNFPNGQSISGFYTFDSNTLDTDPDPTYGVYSNAISLLAASTGSYNFASAIGTIGVANDRGTPPLDAYLVSTDSGLTAPAIGGETPHAFTIELWDQSGSAAALASQSLLTSPPVLSGFVTDTRAALSFPSAVGSRQVFFAIDSISAVPESSSRALLLLGLLAIPFAIRLVKRRHSVGSGA